MIVYFAWYDWAISILFLFVSAMFVRSFFRRPQPDLYPLNRWQSLAIIIISVLSIVPSVTDMPYTITEKTGLITMLLMATVIMSVLRSSYKNIHSERQAYLHLTLNLASCVLLTIWVVNKNRPETWLLCFGIIFILAPIIPYIFTLLSLPKGTFRSPLRVHATVGVLVLVVFEFLFIFLFGRFNVRYGDEHLTWHQWIVGGAIGAYTLPNDNSTIRYVIEFVTINLFHLVVFGLVIGVISGDILTIGDNDIGRELTHNDIKGIVDSRLLPLVQEIRGLQESIEWLVSFQTLSQIATTAIETPADSSNSEIVTVNHPTKEDSTM